MMDAKVLRILDKVRMAEIGVYDQNLGVVVCEDLADVVTAAELALLKEAGHPLHDFETFTHAQALGRLLALKRNPALTLEFVTAFFLKGITGEIPRGRQPLMSYLYIKHLHKHAFQAEGRYKTCNICGLPKKEEIDKSDSLTSEYHGHSWNEVPLAKLIDLDDILKSPPPVPTQEDQLALFNLLNFIAEAAPDETPGQLQARIGKAKLLPKTDKLKRYGILQTLAECGIMPNKYIQPKFDAFTPQYESWEIHAKLKVATRADIILPLAGWSGKDGVNFDRYYEIFG